MLKVTLHKIIFENMKETFYAMIEQVLSHPRSLTYYEYAKSHETGFGWVLLGPQETAITNGELPSQEEPL